MPHSVPVIATIAASLGVAFVLGFVMTKLRLPTLVGYLLAGVLLSPAVPGFEVEAHLDIALELAEVGVMLLMFGVGLHFSLDDLWSVRKIALPGAVLQMVVATALGMGMGALWGWSFGECLIFGIALSVASTVVLLKALESYDKTTTMNHTIAVGWLVVEDLAVVVILVLLPPLSAWIGGAPQPIDAGVPSAWMALGETLLRVTGFIAVMLVVGRRVFPWLLMQTAKTGLRELFILCVISTAVCIAYISAMLFGVSFALGAFFAGMMLRYSEFSHRAAEESLPLQDAFAVLFFVSVGMLFDPMILVNSPFKVLCVLIIIVLGKSLAACGLIALFRYPLSTALTVSAGLAQIGEFSFILITLGAKLELVTPEIQQLIIAGAILSISINPLIFKCIHPIQKRVYAHPKLRVLLLQTDDPLAELPMSTDEQFLSGQVILAGYGGTAKCVAKMLSEHHIPYVVIEHNRELIESLREANIPAVYGNATEASVLIQAHVARASMIVISTPHIVQLHTIAEIAKTLNPDIEMVIRTDSEGEAEMLQAEALGRVFNSKHELALNLGRYVLERYGKLSTPTQ